MLISGRLVVDYRTNGPDLAITAGNIFRDLLEKDSGHLLGHRPRFVA